MDTAGLRWQPEMCPMAKAMVSSVRPKASATPRNPMPRFGNAAASTALPQPPKTNQKVPRNSAIALFLSGTGTSVAQSPRTTFRYEKTRHHNRCCPKEGALENGRQRFPLEHGGDDTP